MKNSLTNYMDELNSTIKKINGRKNLDFDKSIILPLLEYLTANNLISQEELN